MEILALISAGISGAACATAAAMTIADAAAVARGRYALRVRLARLGLDGTPIYLPAFPLRGAR